MSILEDATSSLERMQSYDPAVLVRENELGTKNFSGAVPHAERLIDLYKRLSTNALQDFPDDQLRQVIGRADGDYQLLTQIESFHVDKTTAERDQIIGQLHDAYSPTFATLHHLIAYSLHRSADFQRLDAEARATLQSINDKSTGFTDSLKAAQDDAQKILAEVRATAAETGVSQQASFFKETADGHESEATTWKTKTNQLAWATGIFAALSMGLHRIPFLAPGSSHDTVQLAISKILIFAVLSYLLFLAARNFLAHKHNAVVNRHRQQALQTYKSLVEAAADDANRDIVLTHASACIFGPQASGYSADGHNNAPSAKSVVELLGGGISKAT